MKRISRIYLAALAIFSMAVPGLRADDPPAQFSFKGKRETTYRITGSISLKKSTAGGSRFRETLPVKITKVPSAKRPLYYSIERKGGAWVFKESRSTNARLCVIVEGVGEESRLVLDMPLRTGSAKKISFRFLPSHFKINGIDALTVSPASDSESTDCRQPVLLLRAKPPAEAPVHAQTEPESDLSSAEPSSPALLEKEMHVHLLDRDDVVVGAPTWDHPAAAPFYVSVQPHAAVVDRLLIRSIFGVFERDAATFGPLLHSDDLLRTIRINVSPTNRASQTAVSIQMKHGEQWLEVVGGAAGQELRVPDVASPGSDWRLVLASGGRVREVPNFDLRSRTVALDLSEPTHPDCRTMPLHLDLPPEIQKSHLVAKVTSKGELTHEMPVEDGTVEYREGSDCIQVMHRNMDYLFPRFKAPRGRFRSDPWRISPLWKTATLKFRARIQDRLLIGDELRQLRLGYDRPEIDFCAAEGRWSTDTMISETQRSLRLAFKYQNGTLQDNRLLICPPERAPDMFEPGFLPLSPTAPYFSTAGSTETIANLTLQPRQRSVVVAIGANQRGDVNAEPLFFTGLGVMKRILSQKGDHVSVGFTNDGVFDRVGDRKDIPQVTRRLDSYSTNQKAVQELRAAERYFTSRPDPCGNQRPRRLIYLAAGVGKDNNDGIVLPPSGSGRTERLVISPDARPDHWPDDGTWIRIGDLSQKTILKALEWKLR